MDEIRYNRHQKPLRVAIVGGGRRCSEMLEMVALGELKMEVIGVADINQDAPGIKSAREKGIYTTSDYKDLYKLEGLDLIMELTGDQIVHEDINQAKPYDVQVVGYIGARLLWDVVSDERKVKGDYITLAESSLTGIYIYQDGRFKFVNERFAEMFGYAKEELVGMEVWNLIHPQDREILRGRGEKRLKGEDPPSHYECRGVTKDGSTIWLDVRATVVEYKGRPAVLVNTQDITQRKQMEEEVLKQSAVSETINRVLLETLMCETDEEVARTCLAVAEELTGSKFGFIGEVNQAGRFDAIALSDPGWEACRMPRTDAVVMIEDMEIRGIWGRVLKDEQPLIVNDPASHPDRVGIPEGHPPINSFLGVPLKHAGKTFGIIGLANKESGYDLADQQAVEILSVAFVEALMRKRMEEALKESEEKYRRIFETSKDILYLTSREGKFIDINQAGVDLFGYSKEDLLKIDLARHLYVNPDDRKRFQEMIEKHGFVKDYEVQFKKKDGTKIYVSLTATVRRDRNGKISGYEGIIRDITEKKKAEEKIKRLYEKTRDLADKDALTGLFNHRRINELLEDEIERAKRGTDAFSIMMLDVDDLKLINDAHGHIVGDKLLKNVATILKNASRSIDSIGRYGGDEFLMILPYTDGEKAKTIAQRISQQIKQQELMVDKQTTIPLRLSIGVATYPFDSILPQDLISLADRRMYESKRSGRTVVSTSIPEVTEYLTTESPSFDVLEGLVAVVNSKDHYTKTHSDLVTRFSLSLGKEVNLSQEQMKTLKIAGLLHDIGKIGIPDSILRKPGPLKTEEFEIIKQHPRLGATMLSPPPHREDVMGVIMFHHERYDGKGYPSKLKGKDIPLLARIIGVADAYSAMITDRPYRKALTKDQAIEELKKGAGTQFDPDLVSRFIRCLKESES